MKRIAALSVVALTVLFTGTSFAGGLAVVPADWMVEKTQIGVESQLCVVGSGGGDSGGGESSGRSGFQSTGLQLKTGRDYLMTLPTKQFGGSGKKASQGGAVDPTTGKYYPRVGGVVVDPQTGRAFPIVP